MQINAAKLDPARFSVLYERYYKLIFLFIHHRIKEKDTTADITSQVFLKAMLNLNRYKDKGFPFSSWLYRIAFNEMNMMHRKSKKVIEVEIQESDAIEMIGELNENYNEENGILVLQSLELLPDDLNELIELRFIQKLSFLDIAGIFEITEANAKMKVYRAVEKLKVLFLELKKNS